MDPTQLAQAIAYLIAPFLPELLARSETLLEDAESGALGPVRARAAQLWQRLRSPLEANPGAQSAVEMAVSRPDDARARAALELHLENILEHNEALAAELAEVVEESRVAEAVEAIGEIRAAVSGAHFDERTLRVLLDDLDVAEREACTPKPSLPIMCTKLVAVAELAASAATAAEQSRGVKESVERALPRVRAMFV